MSLGNKAIFSHNLKDLMNKNNKTAAEICNDLNFKRNTFSDWINMKTYPRIDKIEMLANYFNVKKSDLIENQDNNNLFKELDYTALCNPSFTSDLLIELAKVNKKDAAMLMAFLKAINEQN